MIDEDRDIRELLDQMAGEMRLDPQLPPSVRKRARRRRLTTVAVAGSLAALLLVGGFVGVRAFGGNNAGRLGNDPTPESDWRGIWPHQTREEAERAQAAVDEGHLGWLLDLEHFVEAYAMEELHFLGVRFDDSLDVGDVNSPGPLEIRVANSCDDADASCYAVAETSATVTIERLLRRDRTGIWSVVDVSIRTSPAPPPSPATEREVRDFVERFMQHRIDESGTGDGGQEFLTQQAAALFDNHVDGIHLYGSPVGDPEAVFVGFEIGSVDVSELGGYAVQVRLHKEPLTGDRVEACEETVVVGPGENVNGEAKPLVVWNVYGGACKIVAD